MWKWWCGISLKRFPKKLPAQGCLGMWTNRFHIVYFTIAPLLKIHWPACFSQDLILQGGACCIWALTTAIHRMDQCELLMDQSDADYIADHFMDCLLHWQGMKRSCKDAGVKRWGFRPKHHYLEHLSESVRRTRINPRHLSCFQDESYLGSIKHIACKTHAATALLRIFQRLILNLGLRFHEARGGYKNQKSPKPGSSKQQVPSLL